MTHRKLGGGFRSFRLQSKTRNLESRIVCALCFAFCILSFAGCGEKENKNLANARELIQQGKYKESADITGLRSELDLALQADPESSEALCSLKALDIVAPDTNTAARKKAVEEVISLVTSVEKEIKGLEAIDKDLLTDDDKDRLKELNRKWNISLELAALILEFEPDWISDAGQPAIDLLIELLKASNPAIQREVVKRLVSLEDQTFDVLIEALQNESGVVRQQASIALGKIGDDRAVEPIAVLLDYEDPGVRFHVPVALEMIGGEKIIEPLHKALGNETAKVRSAAANILGKMEDETGIDLLVGLLADNDSYVKTSATDVLKKIGKPAVPKLIEVLDTEAKNISLPITDSIGDKIGDEYEKALAKQAALQVSAASILGSINDTRAVKPLLEAMRRKADDDATEDEKANAASIRSGAAAALAAMGPAAVEPLIEILSSPMQDEDARISAASILGAIADKRAVEPLISALKDEKKGIRASAAAAFGTLKMDEDLTDDEEEEAEEWIASIGKDRRAVPQLIEALKDADAVTRANAAASLGVIADKRATQPLIDVIMNATEREKTRSAAITSLGTLGDAAALEPLVKILINEKEKEGVRKNVMSALRKMENAGASEPLIALLKGEVVAGISMPEKGVISKWSKEEGAEARIEDWPAPAEISTGAGQVDAKIPFLSILRRGTIIKLIKIWVPEGAEAEAGDLIALISYKDKDIDQSERASIRSVAASALGLVRGDNALPALKRSLEKDKSAAVRKNAASSLGELENADARSALIDALKGDGNGIVRSNAAYALGIEAIRSGESVPPLINALRKDKYDSTRKNAAWALGVIEDKRAVGPLVDVIVKGRKGKPEASAVVAEAIDALDELDRNAVPSLVAVLQDEEIDEVPRGKAAKILGLIKRADAAEPLIAALKDESVVVRSEAAKALGPVGDLRAVKPLIDALQNEDEWVTVRANAVTALKGLKHEDSLIPLIDALGSEVTAIRSNAASALGPLKDKRATVPLIRVLENDAEDDAIRASAISSLGTIGDLSAVDALLTALDSDSTAIREGAVAALGELAADAAIKPLISIVPFRSIVSDRNQPLALRAGAVEALGEIGDESAAPLLQERLADNNEFDAVWKQSAVSAGKMRVTQVPEWVSERALDEWEPEAVRYTAFMALAAGSGDFDAMLKMLESDAEAIRAGAALVLGETGRKEAVQPLIDRLLNDPEPEVRRDSAKGLAALADLTSEQDLIKAHKEDGTNSVKIQSALALGDIKGEAGIDVLIETLGSDNERNVRANAAKALGNAGSDKAVPALRKALGGNTAVIHFEAAEALRKITGEDVGYQR